MPKKITYTCTEHMLENESTPTPKKCGFQCTNKLHIKIHKADVHNINEPTLKRASP